MEDPVNLNNPSRGKMAQCADPGAVNGAKPRRVAIITGITGQVSEVSLFPVTKHSFLDEEGDGV